LEFNGSQGVPDGREGMERRFFKRFPKGGRNNIVIGVPKLVSEIAVSIF
jgi:hypothetical protein